LTLKVTQDAHIQAAAIEKATKVTHARLLKCVDYLRLNSASDEEVTMSITNLVTGYMAASPMPPSPSAQTALATYVPLNAKSNPFSLKRQVHYTIDNSVHDHCGFKGVCLSK
jgi:hypothetical protein